MDEDVVRDLYWGSLWLMLVKWTRPLLKERSLRFCTSLAASSVSHFPRKGRTSCRRQSEWAEVEVYSQLMLGWMLKHRSPCFFRNPWDFFSLWVLATEAAALPASPTQLLNLLVPMKSLCVCCRKLVEG